ncbi:CWF19-like protein 1 [Uloborus diversus]|uniref:CWF19-like protein 1 n=1 Tax=Uloborus diversus TaxID=327109 RepID=UPI00240A4BDE|nr:CWF19-like protein 1 [Uloborus diversus]
MPRLKVLVAGSILGHFKAFFEEIVKVNKKCGPFECVLCVGEFFGPKKDEWQLIGSGVVEAPIVTYILGPSNIDYKEYFKESGELAPNIHYLGKSGVLKCTSGLQVAYLSGIYGIGDKSVYFDEKDVGELIKTMQKERKIDILLTSQWPKGITKYEPGKNVVETEKNSSHLISKLAQTVKPKYHFSSCPGYFFAPTPYRNDPWPNDDHKPITRFVSVSSFGGPKKWLYAFNITPKSRPDPDSFAPEPRDTTECPYPPFNKKPDHHFSYFKHDSGYAKHGRSSASEMESRPKKQKEDCWFCLSSGEVNKHLIVSVGEHCYLALAKGPLVPDNVLILPIKHVKSSVELSHVEMEEVNKYKNCLVKFFDKRDKDVVFYERNYCSRHLQLQVVPIPKFDTDKIKRVLTHQALEQYEFELTELSEFTQLKEVVGKEKQFFYFEIVKNKKVESKLIHIIPKSSKFPLYFGRDVLASPEILNVPGRVDWKQHAESKESEAAMTQQFIKAFKPFDFTM